MFSGLFEEIWPLQFCIVSTICFKLFYLSPKVRCTLYKLSYRISFDFVKNGSKMLSKKINFFSKIKRSYFTNYLAPFILILLNKFFRLPPIGFKLRQL